MSGKYLRIKSAVRYRQYGNQVYLRNSETRKEYLFNPIVSDLLDHIGKDCWTEEDEILAGLAKEYEISDIIAFRQDIREFLEDLVREKILEQDPEPAKDSETSVLEQVETLCSREHILFSACMELTYRCNERCVHCYVDDIDREYGELTTDHWLKVLEQLHALGCMKILLTGGEVLLRKDFPEIVRYASRLEMLVDIFTNGLIFDENIYDELYRLKVNSLSFSLYSGEADVHDRITGVKGSFERTLRSIMITKCSGIDTYIKTVVIKENADSLESLYRLGKRLNVPVAPSYMILDTHNGCSGSIHRLEEIESYRRAIRLENKPVTKEAVKPRDPESLVCSAGQYSLCIDPFGNVTPCNALHLPLGNVTETNLADIWDQFARRPERQIPRLQDICGKCGECEAFSDCGLCLGYMHWYPGWKASVPPEICTIAHARMDIRNEINNERSNHYGKEGL